MLKKKYKLTKINNKQSGGSIQKKKIAIDNKELRLLKDNEKNNFKKNVNEYNIYVGNSEFFEELDKKLIELQQEKKNSSNSYDIDKLKKENIKFKLKLHELNHEKMKNDCGLRNKYTELFSRVFLNGPDIKKEFETVFNIGYLRDFLYDIHPKEDDTNRILYIKLINKIYKQIDIILEDKKYDLLNTYEYKSTFNVLEKIEFDYLCYYLSKLFYKELFEKIKESADIIYSDFNDEFNYEQSLKENVEEENDIKNYKDDVISGIRNISKILFFLNLASDGFSYDKKLIGEVGSKNDFDEEEYEIEKDRSINKGKNKYVVMSPPLFDVRGVDVVSKGIVVKF